MILCPCSRKCQLPLWPNVYQGPPVASVALWLFHWCLRHVLHCDTISCSMPVILQTISIFGFNWKYWKFFITVVSVLDSTMAHTVLLPSRYFFLQTCSKCPVHVLPNAGQDFDEWDVPQTYSYLSWDLHWTSVGISSLTCWCRLELLLGSSSISSSSMRLRLADDRRGAWASRRHAFCNIFFIEFIDLWWLKSVSSWLPQLMLFAYYSGLHINVLVTIWFDRHRVQAPPLPHTHTP